MPAGCALDLNGVVKSATVDDAVELLGGDGFVSAGGDLAVRGPVVVSLPGDGAVSVVRGGIATSGSGRRRWRRAGALHHHLVDPRTGRSAETPWEAVTASGATCVAADVAARAGFLRRRRRPGAARPVGDPGAIRRRRRRIAVNDAWAGDGRGAARASDVESDRLVRGPRGRDRRVPAAHGGRYARGRDGRPGARPALEAVADVRRRGRAPRRRPARRNVHRAPRGDDRDRLVPPVLARAARDPARRRATGRSGRRSASSPPSCCSRSR